MLFVTIILDGAGIGAQPDAAAYGDDDSHTLGHICEVAHPDLPNLASLGLGCIDHLEGVPPVSPPLASFGRMTEVSAGKDSTTGHWELAGLRLPAPFPTYPNGFPQAVIDAFLDRTGSRGTLGNKPASGTEIIAELGEAHQMLGFPIVYTSADSVFQIAAHEETIPLDELYRICRIAREEICVGEHNVGRVIARPFIGEPGAYQRVSSHRKDFSRKPSGQTVQEALQAAGVRTISVGKIADLFGGVGFEISNKTKSNAEGIAGTIEAIRTHAADERPTFVWTNLVDFDEKYGHRNDPYGFAKALEEFDRAVPELVASLPPDSRLLITADHGNDPITPSTDHSREYVPLLYLTPGGAGVSLGTRSTFNDHAATVARYFGVRFDTQGTAF